MGIQPVDSLTYSSGAIQSLRAKAQHRVTGRFRPGTPATVVPAAIGVLAFDQIRGAGHGAPSATNKNLSKRLSPAAAHDIHHQDDSGQHPKNRCDCSVIHIGSLSSRNRDLRFQLTSKRGEMAHHREQVTDHLKQTRSSGHHQH